MSRMNGHGVKESRAELKERLRKRSQNSDLSPSMFLWKDFGERPALRVLCGLIRVSTERAYMLRSNGRHKGALTTSRFSLRAVERQLER